MSSLTNDLELHFFFLRCRTLRIGPARRLQRHIARRWGCIDNIRARWYEQNRLLIAWWRREHGRHHCLMLGQHEPRLDVWAFNQDPARPKTANAQLTIHLARGARRKEEAQEPIAEIVTLSELESSTQLCTGNTRRNAVCHTPEEKVQKSGDAAHAKVH